MICSRCGRREATAHAKAVTEAGVVLREAALCPTCADAPRRVHDADVAGVLAVEASGRAMPPGWYAGAAEDFARRAAYHGDALPPEVAAFVARHRRAAP